MFRARVIKTPGTYWLSDFAVSGSGCDLVCTLVANSETVTVTIGADTLVRTFHLQKEALSSLLKGNFLVTSSITGFSSTGYTVGQTVGANLVVDSGPISSRQIKTDAVQEPGTIAMVGSGLLMAAGALRCKLL